MTKKTILSISGVRLKPHAPPIDTMVNPQEILGLSGLDGHGQAEFLESLAGVYTPIDGTVTAHTTDTPQHIYSLHHAQQAKIGYMPSDRKKNGIFPNLGVQDNFTIGNTKRFSWFGCIQTAQAERTLDTYQDELSILYAHRHIPMSQLSGGNQQKVLLARAMANRPKVMLLNDPTRGVDIQTRRALYAYFRTQVAQNSMTLVVLSTELDEILEICDRVLVFRDFSISAHLNKNQMTMDRLMSAMFGQHTNGE